MRFLVSFPASSQTVMTSATNPNEKSLSIGHKGMLKTLKLFTAYCMAEGLSSN